MLRFNKASEKYINKIRLMTEEKKIPLHIIIKCFVGSLVKQGNKIRAQRIFAKILTQLSLQTNLHPLYVIQYALLLLRPSINLVTRKRGPHTFQIPTAITRERSFRIAIHWLLKNCKKKTGSLSFINKVTNEILAIVAKKPTSLLTIRSEIQKGIVASRSNFKKLKRFVTSINKLSPRQQAHHKWHSK